LTEINDYLSSEADLVDALHAFGDKWRPSEPNLVSLFLRDYSGLKFFFADLPPNYSRVDVCEAENKLLKAFADWKKANFPTFFRGMGEYCRDKAKESAQAHEPDHPLDVGDHHAPHIKNRVRKLWKALIDFQKSFDLTNWSVDDGMGGTYYATNDFLDELRRAATDGVARKVTMVDVNEYLERRKALPGDSPASPSEGFHYFMQRKKRFCHLLRKVSAFDPSAGSCELVLCFVSCQVGETVWRGGNGSCVDAQKLGVCAHDMADAIKRGLLATPGKFTRTSIPRVGEGKVADGYRLTGNGRLEKKRCRG